MMDHSKSTMPLSNEAQHVQHRYAVLRALVSAATFGTLGAFVGRWLGKHGNDPTSNMSELMMKWSMGIFCAVLGAYSSLKVTQHMESEQANAQALPTKNAALDNNAAIIKTPINAVKYEGKLGPASPHVALEK